MTSAEQVSVGGPNRLARNALGVPGIVFLVLAAVAPLTGMVVVGAIGIAVGNGSGMVWSFILVSVSLLLFAVGYAQMSRKLVSAGGFYSFVVKGLGRPFGLVSALVALLGYNMFVAGGIGTSGFFTAFIVDDVFGPKLHWTIWSAISVVLVFALSRRGIEFSAKVLGVCLVLEVSILLVMDFSIVFQHGLSFSVFQWSQITTGSMGLGLLFAANAFVGFEATSLFSEEARDPGRTIPRATYLAIGFIGLFTAFTTWCIVSAVGVSSAQDAALKHLPTGDLVFSISQDFLGTFLTKVMMVLLLVSLFAALLALHNSATRYVFALGRVGILPRALGRTDAANGSPRNASIAQLGFAGIIAGIYGVAGLDPITDLTASMTGFGTLGILTLQAFAAVSIVVYFRRLRDPRIWKTLVAPGIGGIGIITIVVLAVVNFSDLAGSQDPLIAKLPYLLLAALVIGLGAAVWLRKNRPQIYAELDTDLERFSPTVAD
ncbi:APC family permease [Aeromicrobium sp. 9AM]|uniref:APC family permease n=1 Tax=Aeromicrobium sp. 9AM TaxID=2653126 RepID=UPI0012F371E9|nr:APC family permease [Aeromicrobium sp. 9AM]VXB63451.1 Amino acid permease [Aeromicrobium sp. 9AM]